MKKVKFKIIFLIFLLITLIITSLLIGRYYINFSEIINTNPKVMNIILNIRLPRIIAAILVGIGLSISGATYQAIFKNPMVSPNILGVGSATSFGIALSIILHISYAMTITVSFLCGVSAVLISYYISKLFRYDKRLGLVLSGIMISTIFSSLLSYVKLVADTDNELPDITYWLMGSLSGVNYKAILMAIFPFGIGILVIVLLRWRINLFTMGEEAKTLGINMERMKFILILAATLLTSASISLCGNIGFVGLVIPHFMRLFIGTNYKNVIIASIFAGSSFLLIVDNLARSISTYEVPLGILTALIGAPIFISLLARRNYD